MKIAITRGLHGFQKISSGGDKVKREKLNLGEKVALLITCGNLRGGE